MGTEFKVSAKSTNVFNEFSVQTLKTYCGVTEMGTSKMYSLGCHADSHWVDLTVWEKEGALGITMYEGRSDAGDEVHARILELKKKIPDLEITDWDSGDDLSEVFFSD